MLNELIERIEVHQSEKVDGEHKQKLTIHYCCIRAVEIPIIVALPKTEIRMQTRSRQLFTNCVYGGILKRRKYLYSVEVYTIIKHNNSEEIEIIKKILAFEEQALLECKSKLLKYQDTSTKLGIEIEAKLLQERGLYGARVEHYDISEKQRLPRFYSSKIVCYTHKDGCLLRKQEDYYKRVTSFFVMIFPLVRAWKKDVEFTDNPLGSLDKQASGLFDRISKHLAL